jgi:ribosomal protein S8E
MIRKIQVVADKHAPAQYVAGEALTRGMAVKIDYTTDKVKAQTGAATYFVDVQPNYDGINAVVEPQEKDYESIAAGDKVVLIPVLPGEAYATTEVTVGTLAKGDLIEATAGKFAAKADGDFVFDGAYSDATGLTMYRVVKA